MWTPQRRRATAICLSRRRSSATPWNSNSRNPLSWLAALGVDLQSTTHGEQSFAYHTMAYAGDRLTFHRRIVDVYLKKNGALEFVVKQTDITRGEGEPVAEVLCTIGVKHPEVAA